MENQTPASQLRELTGSRGWSLGSAQGRDQRVSIRPEGRALGDWQLRSGGGEVGDDGGGLRGADDGGAGGGCAAWRDERALGHLAARGVLGVGHHDARVVHVLVVTAPV